MKNHTIENSATNPLIIQALQTQAQQLLPTITQALSARQYSEIAHQRLAQQNGTQTQNTEIQTIKDNCYQGLTRAKYPQFGDVMIKWQLNHYDNPYSANLSHEVDVLKSLNDLLQNQNNSAVIAPSILNYHKIDVQALAQNQKLTVLVMSYYPNGSFAQQLAHQKHLLLTDKQKHHFIKQTAHLVATLHHAGWLHNDIKPSNLLIDTVSINDGKGCSRMPNLVMIDFALAEMIHNPIKSNPAGTPAYLAPERWQGQDATAQSDVYAFGIMMFEILMGKRPFKISDQSSDSMIDWATQHCQQPVPRLPSEYSHYQFIIDGALAKRVEKRYRSMDEVLVYLKRL